MPFEKFDVDEHIEYLCETKPGFKEAWDSSRMEYKLLGELIKLRKEKGISQEELAQRTGSKQQAISRIEKKEHSPTLKSICALAEALDVELQLVPR